ncbi:alpha/beta hydrolase [Terrisporobacter mayombei]|uniref:Monoacylglycerol lipase n=1 Tax=Terrisporobacter mayombei TaxID=1541 RepID=A0ABY9Q1U4_9FIRM|nr:alpha/beta hydrolase [Terrisporobacter mayombei]MCC3867671.1 lysophospholipase [Terrisporobacter mayombei]WMT81933.1 Monoacylglycerol lipase [Terrisporobacter mayombei]
MGQEKVLNESVMFRNKNNIELYVQKNLVEDPKAIIVIVHGLAEHLGRYDYVVSKFNDWGYSVYRFDNQGHGKSEGIRTYIETYKNFAQDVNEIVYMAKNENDDKKVFVLGHSMGGMISTVYGIDYKDTVDGIILSAGVTIDKAKLLESNKDVEDDEQIPNALGNLICTDKRVVDDYEKDPLVCHVTVGKIYKECYKAVKYIYENMSQFEYPVYILHGEDDKIVSSEDSQILYEHISSLDKSLKIYPGLYHEIMNEFDKDKVLEDIHYWLEDRI